jgi:N-acetylglutamate synthase-like GNAT family acetyltransferase
MLEAGLQLREGDAQDLPAINRLIANAVLAWPLADRLKRLAVPLLQYVETDIAHYSLLLAYRKDALVGVAAWAAQAMQFDDEHTGALLHGLYVEPEMQGRGIGRQLMQEVFLRSAAQGFDGVLVKAQRVSADFFAHRGMLRLPADESGEYPYRFWQEL